VSTTTTTTNLHDAALEAFHEREREIETERSQRRLEEENMAIGLLRELLHKRLGIHPHAEQINVEWEGHYSYLRVTATIDGLVFSAYERPNRQLYTHPDDLRTLYLIGKCERCGERTGSDNIRDLADLGSIIHDWVPHCRGGCAIDEDSLDTDVSQEPANTYAVTYDEFQVLASLKELIGRETRYV
jgi:hypothetical protein